MTRPFQVISKYAPAGDQPKAINELSAGIKFGYKHQTLLGVTGSGKTFTMAHVIQNVRKPTLIIAHNKTLAAQLYNEMSELLPMTIISQKLIFLEPILISRKHPVLTMKLTACATAQQEVFLKDRM